VPKKWDNPFLYQDPEFNPAGEEFVDLGLARFLAGRSDLWPENGWALGDEEGKFKVMTLRNIGLTKPYAHNGLFKSLEEITHFYNTRDALDPCEALDHPKPGRNCWPAPEVPHTVNFDELGNLGLSDKDEANLVAFMKTLSDGWKP
jgi:cytochrome c peroxidase